MNKNYKYDDLTVEELIKLAKVFNDRAIIHNGHITGFSREV